MDGLKFLHNYDLDCVATKADSGEVLFKFKARELAQREDGAGFVSGGIASGSLKYQIKTNDERIKQLKPFINNIIVEGIDYALVFLKIRKADLPFAYEWQRGIHDEYVLELQ